MQYKTDREMTEDLMAIRLFSSVVWHGADHEAEGIRDLLQLFRDAEKDITSSLTEKAKQKILRRSFRIHDDIIKPYHDEGIAVAKFGLVVFYALDKLREQGFFHLVEGSALDKAIEALLHEDGTLVQFANIKKVDDSARRRAKKMLAQLQANGLYAGASWE